MSVDYRELSAFKDKLDSLSQAGLDGIEQKLCNELANRVVRAAVKITPVDTGHLKGSYRTSAVYPTGDGYSITVYNPVRYAPYVEYGHRTRGGGWCEGKFMLTKATEQVEKNAEGIVGNAINREIQRALK